MPVTPTYPGVYIEEVPSGVHPITGVATSIAAFVGFARRGPVNEPTTVQSFAEFSRMFGGLWSESTMSQAVSQFFLNGGSQAVIIRTADLATAAKATVKVDTLSLEAANEGQWGENLLVRVDYETSQPTVTFNLSIKDTATNVVEVLRNLTASSTLATVIAQQSQLVRAVSPLPTVRPAAHATVAPGDDPFSPTPPGNFTQFTAGTGVDGPHNDSDLVPAPGVQTGMYALTRADLFNLLCIPPATPGSALPHVLSGRAATFCRDHRAMFIVDGDPAWTTPAQVIAGLGAPPLGIASDDQPNSALYVPYLRAPDPLQNNAIVDFPPCGAIAGVMARTDARRGVWKAPAGLDAGIAGIQELKSKLTDGENGILNPLGVNCLRTFPASGSVVWGARTLAGNDALASEWKYVPVRRTALFLEESLFRGTQWVVFEPNDEPLWGQIRLNVGAFMQNLFRQGAFQGTTPRAAYLVKCDKETTTQTDINNGVVNILVGFAPLKPAEFVIIRIQQLAGQIET